jgi:hypothetical protein
MPGIFRVPHSALLANPNQSASTLLGLAKAGVHLVVARDDCDFLTSVAVARQPILSNDPMRVRRILQARTGRARVLPDADSDIIAGDHLPTADACAVAGAQMSLENSPKERLDCCPTGVRHNRRHNMHLFNLHPLAVAVMHDEREVNGAKGA